MIKEKDFITTVDKRFWKHISKEGPFKDVIKYNDFDREQFLKEVTSELNNYTYDFTLPVIEYAPKKNGLLRKIKCMQHGDACIYYYVTKKLQNDIVKEIKKVDDVFGGFRMTSELKAKPEDDKPIDPSYENSFSSTQFRKEWSDYQNLAKQLYEDGYKNYLHFDIAHFYDDINLSILEGILQNVSKGKSELIRLLFFFLRNSDRIDLGYNDSTVGIPQESVGEMSRLLANLYLSPYDREFSKGLKTIFGKNKFKYFRYADDMWVAFNGPSANYKRVIQYAGILLQKQKLHLNESKTEILTRKEFNNHWHFDLWERVLKSRKDSKVCLHNSFEIHNRYKKGRWFSPLLYTIRVVTGNKKNVTHFTNLKLAMKFLGRLLGQPKFGMRINGGNKDFFEELFKQYPRLITEVVKPIVDKNFFLNPNVQIFSLELLTMCSPNDNSYYVFRRYFAFNNEPYHWYLRCLCLRYLSRYGHKVSKWKSCAKILKIIIQNEKSLNHFERRDTIHFLLSLKSIDSESVLNKYFNRPEDLKFCQYLKLNP